MRKIQIKKIERIGVLRQAQNKVADIVMSLNVIKRK